MIVYVATRSAGSFGANTTFSLVGKYLTSGLALYRSTITQLEVTACFRGGRVRNSSLQRTYDDYHSSFLPTLPIVRFLRKRGRISIQYATALADATFLERYGFLSAEVFGMALREVGQTLHLIDTRVKKSDDFDLPTFHASIAALVAEATSCDDGLRVLKLRLDREAKERLAAMDPWERLDLDWDEFHTDARTILDDPFFWSSTDGYSPHGNDTGADLFADFKKWNRRNGDAPAYKLAASLLEAWDIARIEYNAVDEITLDALLANDPDAVSVTDDALIAAAFASIKIRGCCDAETRQMSLNAIARERAAAVLESRGWKDGSERVRTLDLMSKALVAAPTSAGCH